MSFVIIVDTMASITNILTISNKKKHLYESELTINMETEEPINMKVNKITRWKWKYYPIESCDLHYCLDHQYESEEFITMLVAFVKVL